MNREQRLQAYIALIGTAGVLVTGFAALATAKMPPSNLDTWLATGVLFAVLCWLSSLQRIYYGESSGIAMGTPAQIAAMIVLPFQIAILAVVAGKVLSEVYLLRRRERVLRATVVNVGGVTLASAMAGMAFRLLNGPQFLWGHDLQPILAVPALVALALSYHLVDVLVVVGAISLSTNESPWSAFRGTFRDPLEPLLALIFVGVVFAELVHYSAIVSWLIIVPVWLSMRSFAAVARLRKETVEAVLKMAESIDYRDTGTYEHSKRIAEMTNRLARSLGLMPENASDIVLASRVHDLGKIGISNDILLKAGPLTEQERRMMQEHPVIGANILASYSAFENSSHIVRHHHERWDGKGYPDELKGDEIPIGARIVAVVDAYDSMTADRPYRRGMSSDTAVERLKDGMGSQFDPRICAAFIQLLIEDGTYMPPEPAPELHLVSRDVG